jgi:hypothetical protein
MKLKIHLPLSHFTTYSIAGDLRHLPSHEFRAHRVRGDDRRRCTEEVEDTLTVPHSLNLFKSTSVDKIFRDVSSLGVAALLSTNGPGGTYRVSTVLDEAQIPILENLGVGQSQTACPPVAIGTVCRLRRGSTARPPRLAHYIRG